MKEIPVVYQDGMMDMVDPQALQELLDADEIVKFQRADGWVYPGVDPVRRRSRLPFLGADRRMLRRAF